MSLDELPDELIAQVASHMKLRDVFTLLITQKRIHNVIKRYKLHKPAVDHIRFDLTLFGTVRARCLVNLERGQPPVCVRQEELSGTENEFIASCLDKFKSVSSLFIYASNAEIFMNEELYCILLNADLNIKNIKFEEIEIKFKSDSFVSFILCQILPKTKFDFVSHYTISNTQLEISDRTLDVMIKHKLPKEFLLDRPRTNFTMAGVRRLAEFCSDSDYEYEIALGILNKDQAAEAQQWFNYYAQRQRALPYELELFQNGRRLQQISGRKVVPS